ncbi:MAG: DUF3106 domain-containing protein [Deltaproteobacteria bacterium]|nr:DUF3106 domain-containing protein [Deltaproteobacteria bacterium]
MAERRLGAIVATIACALTMLMPAAHAGDRMQLAQGWDQLTPGQRQRAQENYDRWKKMPQSRQQQLERSYQQWQGMRPSEKERMRRNYDAYRQMSPDQRRQLLPPQGGKGNK